MPRFLKILLGIVVVLLAAGGGAFLWLTAREAVPAETDYVIDLEELRSLADSLPGAKPKRDPQRPRRRDVPAPGGALRRRVLRAPPDGAPGVPGAVSGGRRLPADRHRLPRGEARADGRGREVPRGGVRGGADRPARARSRSSSPTSTSTTWRASRRVAAPESLVGRLRLTREQLANAKAADDAELPGGAALAAAPRLRAHPRGRAGSRAAEGARPHPGLPARLRADGRRPRVPLHRRRRLAHSTSSRSSTTGRASSPTSSSARTARPCSPSSARSTS